MPNAKLVLATRNVYALDERAFSALVEQQGWFGPGPKGRIPLHNLISPRLRQFVESSEAESHFWRDLKLRGTPLVEPLANNSEEALLTFVYRGSQDVDRVWVFGTAAMGEPMSLLEGSDIWFLTKRVRTTLRGTYRFSPNCPITDLRMAPDLPKLEQTLVPDPLNRLRCLGHLSAFELPDAPAQRWLRDRLHGQYPRFGSVLQRRYSSRVLGNERNVAIYLPAQMGSSTCLERAIDSALRMIAPLDVRNFEADHQQQAAELINSGLGERFGFRDDTKNPDLYDIAAYYRQDCFLVAVHGGEVISTGALIYESRSVVRVVRMRTARHFRRRGVGTRVLNELETRARQYGALEIVLETDIGWANAHAFCRASGHEELRRSEPGILFHKLLAPSGQERPLPSGATL